MPRARTCWDWPPSAWVSAPTPGIQATPQATCKASPAPPNPTGHWVILEPSLYAGYSRIYTNWMTDHPRERPVGQRAADQQRTIWRGRREQCPGLSRRRSFRRHRLARFRWNNRPRRTSWAWFMATSAHHARLGLYGLCRGLICLIRTGRPGQHRALGHRFRAARPRLARIGRRGFLFSCRC